MLNIVRPFYTARSAFSWLKPLRYCHPTEQLLCYKKTNKSVRRFVEASSMLRLDQAEKPFTWSRVRRPGHLLYRPLCRAVERQNDVTGRGHRPLSGALLSQHRCNLAEPSPPPSTSPTPPPPPTLPFQVQSLTWLSHSEWGRQSASTASRPSFLSR